MPKKKASFEQSLSRLEEVVDLMEDPQTGMDDLVNYYKEAIELTVFLNDALTGYEHKVTELTKTAEGITEKNFEGER